VTAYTLKFIVMISLLDLIPGVLSVYLRAFFRSPGEANFL